MTSTKEAEDVLVEQIRDLLTRATPGPWGCTTRQGSWDWVVFCEADPNIEICQPFHDGTEDNELGEANASLIALVPQMVDAITTLLERVAELEKQRLMVLAAVYGEAPKFVATICDEKLDRSGALLGEVRALARAALTREGG